MTKETFYDEEPTPTELARLRAALADHAQEIALACATAGDAWVVHAIVLRDGQWWGTLTAAAHEDPGPYVRKDALTFVVPARYRTVEAVRQLVREHLGPGQEQEGSPPGPRRD